MTLFARLTPGELARFMPRTRADGECLVWTGKLDRDGYGMFYLRRKNRRAHRVAYYATHGDIPPEMVINHTCRNRACVNPDHIEAVTTVENVFRNSMSAPAINARKTHCPKGHPYDRKYGKQRSCSQCETAKKKRLMDKWKNSPDFFKGC